MLTHAIPQLNAALADRYGIVRELGRGGMATVYLARDLRHERHVALKVVDPELGAVLGVERFLAEIRVTANLQHPHLLPLFDSGEAGGLLYYVMPYVEGESLRARIDRERQLPIDEALRIAIAVAGALDYAHRHGVIHRDLKPENILLHEGQPLVADFGIALAVSNAGGNRITQTGVSLGTPQYMSPEQATGDRQIDGRTDIYSLGAVTYEMLTGEPPHSGTTAQAVIAKLMTTEPPTLRMLRPSVPLHAAVAVERSLAKLPADRWATAREFAEALDGAHPMTLPVGSSTITAVAAARGDGAGSRRARVMRAAPWLVAGITSAAAIVAFALLAERGRDERTEPVMRVLMPLSDSMQLSRGAGGSNVAISPDGSRFVYTTGPADERRLAVRSLDDLTPKALPGTEGASAPTFSPDGRSIAFRSGNRIQTIPVAGGTLTTVVEIGKGSAGVAGLGISGLSWDDRGDVIFSAPDPAGNSILWRVRATGGAPAPVTRPETSRSHVGATWPQVLPGSHAALVTLSRNPGLPMASGVGIVDLDDGTVTDLGITGTTPHYVPGYIVYALRDGSIMVAPFDAATRRVAGAAIQIGADVLVKFGGVAQFAISRTGTMIAITGTERRRLVLTDRKGTVRPLVNDVRNFITPRRSPDGRRIAVGTISAAESAIWIYDLASNTVGRLATDIALNRPEWSPDGTRIYYVSWLANEDCLTRQGQVGACSGLRNAVLRRRWDGSGSVDTVIAPSRLIEEVFPLRDSRHVVLREGTAWFARFTVFTLDSATARDSSARPLGSTPYAELGPRVSPDGQWLAYSASAEGQGESHVYVRPFPGPGGRTQISTEPGSSEPVWSPDGRELFYRSPTHLMAVTLQNGAIVKRETLFDDVYTKGSGHAGYDVMPDGQHFIMVKPVDTESNVLLVVNGLADVKARLAAEARR